MITFLSAGKIVNMATVRPNNVAGNASDVQQQLRSAISMPHLAEDSTESRAANAAVEPNMPGQGDPSRRNTQRAEPQQAPKVSTAVPLAVLGPPKPPRVNASSDSQKVKSEIRAALHCWHMGMLQSDSESAKSGSDFELR
jgi:hypothetical protein